MNSNEKQKKNPKPKKTFCSDHIFAGQNEDRGTSWFKDLISCCFVGSGVLFKDLIISCCFVGSGVLFKDLIRRFEILGFLTPCFLLPRYFSVVVVTSNGSYGA